MIQIHWQIFSSYPKSSLACLPLAITGLLFMAAQPTFADGDCSAFTSNMQFQDTPAAECPNGSCSSNATPGPLTQAVLNGCDPPVSLRPDVGQGINFAGMGGATISGKCAPAIGQAGAQPGTFSCQAYTASSNASTNGGNSTNQALQSLLASLANLQLGNGTGALSPSDALVNNQVGTNNLNVCPVGLSGLSGSLPQLPCGGAMSLNNQSFTIGPITFNAVTTTGPSVEVSMLGGSGWCNDGSALTGTTLALSQTTFSITLPPTTSAIGYSGGSISPPVGSIINIPGGNPVSFSITTAGSITLPVGGTFTGPDSTVYTIPPYGTLVSAGNNTVQLPNGTILTYQSSVASIPINTTAVLIGTVTALSGGTTFSLSSYGTLMLPSGGSIIGPDKKTYTIAQNGILTSLGGGQLQLPNGGGVLSYPAGTSSVPVTATSVLTPPPAATSLAINASTGVLISPQTPASTASCGNTTTGN